MWTTFSDQLHHPALPFNFSFNVYISSALKSHLYSTSSTYQSLSWIMSLLSNILSFLLFCSFSFAILSCSSEDTYHQDQKEFIIKNLQLLFETQNNFLKASEVQEEIAISKYKESFKDSNLKNCDQFELSSELVYIEECGCHRENLARKTEHTQSLCSTHASIRGPNQKIVAFSYYGNPHSEKHQVRQYLNGIETNLEAMKEFYPGKV